MEEASTKIVSIIIVTRGTKDYIKSCLASLEDQAYPDLEIIVIDNSLDPNLAVGVNEDYPKVKIYPQDKNLSYCEALNKGIDISVGDFILCLNDDVVLDRSFIEEASQGFYYDLKVGMVSGKVLRPDGITIDSTGLFLTHFRTARERGYGKKDRGQYSSKGYVFGVSGAVAFYRRTMLNQIKIGLEYFDSDFHFFYEDLDVAWRAQNFGWKGYYIPGAAAYHVRGATTRGERGFNKRFARCYLNDELFFDLVKNRYMTIIGNESLLNFLAHLPFIALYDIFALAHLLFFRPKLIKRVLLIAKFLFFYFYERRFKKYILKLE